MDLRVVNFTEGTTLSSMAPAVEEAPDQRQPLLPSDREEDGEQVAIAVLSRPTSPSEPSSFSSLLRFE